MTALAAHRRRPWARAVLVLLALLATGAAYAAAVPKQADAATTSVSDIAAGKKLFLANCSTCHGLNAQGQAGFPSLIGVGAAAVDFQVGTGRMPLEQSSPQAPAQRTVLFSDQQIKQMAAYVASLAPGPAIPTAADVSTAGADPSRGALIFRTNCAMCHNYAGRGGALSHGKYAPNLWGSTPTHIYEALLTGPQSMPVFNNNTIDPQSKRDIIAYLQGIQNAPSPGGLSLGSIGPVSEGLLAWTLGLGLLIGCAVWLGAKAS